MSDRDALDQAISLLRDGPIAMPDPAMSQASRERVLPLMRELVVGTPRRLRRRQQIRSVLSAAGVVTCVGVSWLAFSFQRPEQPSPAMQDTLLVEMPRSDQATWLDGTRAPQLLGTRARVPLRGSLRSLDDRAVTLLTPQSVQVALAEQSQVELGQVALSPNRSVLGLSAGQIRCTVPRLPTGSVFSVRTSDAEVIVHGTVFRVVAPTSNAPTCVRVEEGRVEVRHGEKSEMVEAGSSLGCTAPPSIEPATDAARALAAPGATRAIAAKRSAADSDHPRTFSPSANEKPSGTLAEESRLLAAALVKEREGSRALARELFLALATRYPQSALAVEARAGLMRTREAEPR